MCCKACEEGNDLNRELIRLLKQVNEKIGNATDSIPEEVAGTKIENKNLTQMISAWGQANIKVMGAAVYPLEVPLSLLSGVEDGKTLKLRSISETNVWLIQQLDAILGEFPVSIQVQDIDPLTEGKQTKDIKLPNLAEAIAELYGLTLKNSINSEVNLNALIRVAAETIAAKNAAIVAQDFARANATFLGYKGKAVAREIYSSFDFANQDIDDPKKELVLEKLLKTVKGYVQGWESEDKETVVGFLQKIVFSAGIIKAVFFRGKRDLKRLDKEAKRMAEDFDLDQDQRWKDFLARLNNPLDPINKGQQQQPDVNNQPLPKDNKNGGNKLS